MNCSWAFELGKNVIILKILQDLCSLLHLFVYFPSKHKNTVLYFCLSAAVYQWCSKMGKTYKTNYLENQLEESAFCKLPVEDRWQAILCNCKFTAKTQHFFTQGFASWLFPQNCKSRTYHTTHVSQAVPNPWISFPD